MPTMFHQPYLNKSFNGDFTQLLPPRSASASSCKSSGTFFPDVSKPSSFLSHRTLLPYSELRSTHNNTGFEGAHLDTFNNSANSKQESWKDSYDEHVFSDLKAARKSIYSSDDMILSELLSITRPEGLSSDLNSSFPAELFSDEVIQPGCNAWCSNQAVQELSDLRNNITPRLFRTSSKQNGLAASNINRSDNLSPFEPVTSLKKNQA